jgi:hypothetical protein
VELIQAGAAHIDLKQTFDAAMSTLAIGVIPDYRNTLNRMMEHLNPCGRLSIGDANRSSGIVGLSFNWLADLLGYGAAEDVSRRPWEIFQGKLDDFHYSEWFSGFFYVVAGSAP